MAADGRGTVSLLDLVVAGRDASSEQGRYFRLSSSTWRMILDSLSNWPGLVGPRRSNHRGPGGHGAACYYADKVSRYSEFAQSRHCLSERGLSRNGQVPRPFGLLA